MAIPEVRVVRALVLDGDTRSALAIARSLGGRGIWVIVGSEDQPSLAGCSKYCSERLIYPSPGASPRLFCEWLESILSRTPDVVLYPTSDLTVSILGRYRLGMPCTASIPLPPQPSLEIALNKSATLDLARWLGVPIPKTTEFKRGDPVDPDCVAFPYPVIIKASQSDAAYRPLTGYIYSRDELRTAVTDALRSTPSVLVQECVTGEGTSIFALCDSGEPIVTFAHRRKREKPPWGGISVLSESIDEPEDTLRYASSILRELRWHGIAMVEFKRGTHGVPCLMEINPRFWGSLELAVRSGVDFPYLYFQLALGQRVESPVDRRRAVNRWTLGELDSLISAVCTSRRPDGVPHSRLRCLFSHIWDLRLGPKCEVERISDPKPAAYEYAAWLRTSAGRIISRKKGGIAGCSKCSRSGA